MNLRDIFSAVAYKKLSAVDLPNKGSNQHELDGVSALRDFFHTNTRIAGNITWVLFKDEQDPTTMESTFTFYDSRERNPRRSEWRLYYKGDFLNDANVGDAIFLVRKNDPTGSIFGLVFQDNSGWLRSAEFLFQVRDMGRDFQPIQDDDLNSNLEYNKQQILISLGVEYEPQLSQLVEDIAFEVLERNNNQIPSTNRLARIAWSISNVRQMRDADEILLHWLQKETELFYAIEKLIVEPRLEVGFATIEEFLAFSLSVQNRRKSRMGHSLQNHLGKIFTDNHLVFSAQAFTEDRKQPDFLFPGEVEYHDPAFDTTQLVMLGAKSTCKDRWRQVLDEADRIVNKHLCTLERPISENQTNQMRAKGLTLVIPEAYHITFSPAQRNEIWSIKQFIEYISRKQAGV